MQFYHELVQKKNEEQERARPNATLTQLEKMLCEKW